MQGSRSQSSRPTASVEFLDAVLRSCEQYPDSAPYWRNEVQTKLVQTALESAPATVRYAGPLAKLLLFAADLNLNVYKNARFKRIVTPHVRRQIARVVLRAQSAWLNRRLGTLTTLAVEISLRDVFPVLFLASISRNDRSNASRLWEVLRPRKGARALFRQAMKLLDEYDIKTFSDRYSFLWREQSVLSVTERRKFVERVFKTRGGLHLSANSAEDARVYYPFLLEHAPKEAFAAAVLLHQRSKMLEAARRWAKQMPSAELFQRLIDHQLELPRDDLFEMIGRLPETMSVRIAEQFPELRNGCIEYCVQHQLWKDLTQLVANFEIDEPTKIELLENLLKVGDWYRAAQVVHRLAPGPAKDGYLRTPSLEFQFHAEKDGHHADRSLLKELVEKASREGVTSANSNAFFWAAAKASGRAELERVFATPDSGIDPGDIEHWYRKLELVSKLPKRKRQQHVDGLLEKLLNASGGNQTDKLVKRLVRSLAV